MKVYVDENLPPQLARGLNILQQPLNQENSTIEVVSIRELFSGAKDEEWIPTVERDSVVITQDLKIQRTRHQRDLYQKFGLGIFFFSPPSNKGFSYWDMVTKVIERWDDIRKIIRKDTKPFAYRCTSRSKQFEKLD